jgi:hypothetical protein
MKKEDLFFHIPEFKFPCSELYDWGKRNEKHFRTTNSLLGLNGILIPSHYTKILNDQINLDIMTYNSGYPLIKRGQLYTLTDEYPMHTDPYRDASLNFVLSGDAVTMWDEGTVCEYLPETATLFNTQIPHAVFPRGDVLRMAVSFSVTMNYSRFVNLHKAGLIFGKSNRILRINEIPAE